MLTVIAPASYEALATLESVKAELEISGTADDAVLTTMLRQASADIVRYTNRRWAAERVREVFTTYEPYGVYEPQGVPWGSQYPTAMDGAFAKVAPLLLQRTPVLEVISVEEAGVAVPPTSYALDPEEGIIHRLADGWRSAWWVPLVTIEYVGGYAQADIPGDIQRACTDLVKLRYFSRSRDPALRSERILNVIDSSYTATSSAATKRGLPIDIAQRLDEHRRRAL